MGEHVLAGLRCSDVLDLAAAFVLGSLAAADEEAVRDHVAACPEAHAEIGELGSVVPALFETVEPVEPPARLKRRILGAAAAEAGPALARAGEAHVVVDGPLSPAPAPDGARTALPPAADTERGSRWGAFFGRPVWAAVAAAAVIAAVALGAWNVQLRNDLDAVAAYREGVVEVLEEAARPGAQLAVLTAPEDPAGPTGLAAVGADGSVALVMRDLAPTSGTQVYEAWLIAGDASPVPIGSFTVDASRTASLTTARPSLGAGVTVALSLEPAPGATTPTTVVALGSASVEES